MESLKVIAVTHKYTALEKIGRYHIEDSDLSSRLQHLKDEMKMQELMYISTCNRVEFLFVTPEVIDDHYLLRFFEAFDPSFSAEVLEESISVARFFSGKEAIDHLYRVASSLDSLVVGEREIITQVRKSYETCRSLGLTGDLIRVAMRTTIETAKLVFTETRIAAKPVSVVSLAYRQLKDLNVQLDARFIIIGAGQTNMLMAKFLKKHGFKNFRVYNRTLANAQKLASELDGKAFLLDDLKKDRNGFDVILTCTAAAEHIIDLELYDVLLNGETDKKIIIDLSVPTDTDPLVLSERSVKFIDVSAIQAIAAENMQERRKEMDSCERIIKAAVEDFEQQLKVRKVEKAMSDVPRKIREIKDNAVAEVFARDIEHLDENSKAVLEKILAYVEKKYISVPMKLAREIILDEVNQN